ncbi:hypothetical protein H9L17_09590 [Thermomonas brevis]|uniref:TonB C-terminal domain-containing protein n=1 Tax=Thermomonas brevis TaxID=215691 RepID=A0A7G9QQ55_9GAMM|nr:hypothetical protein [Thermomonas brevis]QNN45480.1 hypothetical protein H9L17_09590 [Thermomonas brevis]
MKKLLPAITAFALLLGMGQAAAIDEPANETPAAARPVLELKGITLGADWEAVKAGLTNPDCDSYADGTAEQCLVQHTTFGGYPAELLVRALDGKVVYVSATRMTQEDAFSAADALKMKYGQPDFYNEVRVTIVRPKRDRSIVFRRPVWKTADGKQAILVVPAAYTDSSNFTYAAVQLFDQHLHNDVWQAKRDGKSLATNDL